MIKNSCVSSTLAVLVCLLVTLPVSTSYSANGGLSRGKVSKPVYNSAPVAQDDKVVFKLAEGLGQPELTARGFNRSGTSWDQLNALLTSPVRTAAVNRHFTLDKSILDEMRAEGSRRIGQQLPHLTLYYEIKMPSGLSGRERLNMINELNALDIVEVAYFAPEPELATVTVSRTLTPAWESRQYYLQAAPTGINAYYGWSLPGGHGENVKVIDIEGNWIETHEDLHGGNDNFHIAGTKIETPLYWEHGTAVLGEIAADPNDFGMTGIAYGVDLGTVSIGSLTTANAIAIASANCVEGDIILIELHAPGPHYDFESRDDQQGYVAMEYWQANFDAILTASALGRIVVEAAGNGAEDFDDTSLYDSLFYPEYRFSGAVMVAASCSDHFPASFTNYGLRIDVHGLGCWDIYTLGYGDLWGDNPDNHYTSTFAGTSSASPIIVGACAVLQGIYENVHGVPLDHAGMRRLLTDYSTPQAPSYKRIGPMPDLQGSCDEVYGVAFTSDVTSGWAPLEVSFFGTSGLAVDTWTWRFGDGGAGYVQSPTYTYQSPGMFDVSLEISFGGETRTKVREDYIIALADTMFASFGSALPGDPVEIVVTGNNTVPLQYIRIPVEWPGDLALTYDSFSTVGCRTDYFEVQDHLHWDPWFGKRVTIRLISSTDNTSPDLPAGEGVIVKLYWTISADATPEQVAYILLSGYESYLPEYQGVFLNYTTEVVPGRISVFTSCCMNRGDFDHSSVVDYSDAIYFADWLWGTGSGPNCDAEADIDGDGEVDPMDAMTLVNYLWRGGDPLVPCQ